MPLNNLNLKKEYHPWTAIFANGDKLSMLDAGREIFFSEVLNRESELTQFYIHLEQDLVAGVNLANGYFTLDGKAWFPPPDHVPALLGDKYRIVYFRRMRMDMNVAGGSDMAARAVMYVLGWQITIEGVNHQRIMEIHPDGNYNWKKKQ